MGKKTVMHEFDMDLYKQYKDCTTKLEIDAGNITIFTREKLSVVIKRFYSLFFKRRGDDGK